MEYLPEHSCVVPRVAGDPRQLGPVVRSPFASLHGLSTSLLERVMEFPIYSKISPDGKYDPRVLTMLVKNYRCSFRLPLLAATSSLITGAVYFRRNGSKFRMSGLHT